MNPVRTYSAICNLFRRWAADACACDSYSSMVAVVRRVASMQHCFSHHWGNRWLHGRIHVWITCLFVCFLAHSLLRTVCAAAYTRESLRLDSHPPRDSVLNSLAIFAIQGGAGSLLFIVERFGCKAAMTQVFTLNM